MPSIPEPADAPLLGAVPPLGDETWNGMLDDAFLAPPGAFDHLVDTFDDLSPTGFVDDAADDGAIDDEHLLDPAVLGGDAGLIDADALDDAEHDAEAAFDGGDAEHALDRILELDLDELPDTSFVDDDPFPDDDTAGGADPAADLFG